MGSEMMFLGHINKQQECNTTKSNFSQTCNRFSQFLKERRSLGHLDAFKSFASSELDIKGVKEVCGQRNNNANAINLFSKSMGKERMSSLQLFPPMNSVAKSAVENSTKDIVDTRELPVPKEESKNNSTTSPSMTIFYGGKVIVFNELPEDKAHEIMSLASRGTAMSSETEPQTPCGMNNLTRGVMSHGPPNLSDFPIARRVSLHRFIEKRKHRIAACAPYQLQKSTVSNEAADSHPREFNMMGSLFDQQQLELKL